jgi:hypothetical protein
MIIEVILYRTNHDAAARRRKDGARVRKQISPKLTPANVDRYDESPGG